MKYLVEITINGRVSKTNIIAAMIRSGFSETLRERDPKVKIIFLPRKSKRKSKA